MSVNKVSVAKGSTLPTVASTAVACIQSDRGRSHAIGRRTATTASAASVGEVDLDAAAVELLLVEAADGRLGLTGRGEGDEAEAAGAASLAIAHHNGLREAQA